MNAREWATVSLLNAAADTTTAQATGVDMSAYASQANREMKAVIAVSALTTITTATVAITECATVGGTYTAPANGTSSVVITTNGIYEINFRNDLRYVRVERTYNAAGTVNLAVAGLALKRFADS